MSDIKLIIGLGNPGKEYANTRHSVGYMVVDALPKSSKFKAFKSDKFIVLKSTVFMNESGKFVKKVLLKYPNIPLFNIYIIHDDLDIKLGEYKIQLGRGPKDHNGLKSIDEELGTNEYWHVRVGVDNRPLDGRVMGEEYVLQNFTDEERKVLENLIKEIGHKIITNGN